MINVAILGYGTVGSGVFEVLNENKESISRRAGQELHVKYVLDLRDFPGQPVEKVLVHDYEQIVSDPEVDIVVEVMGGVEPAYTFVKKALLAGKNVCTSNKALVAKHGRELMDIAKEKSINFLFEASCGGGIPIIRVINSSLTGDEIDEVTGILNGTTNYMLYKMSTEGCEFDTVLKEAQQKGYAEADPTADVEGYDACRKIAILSSLAYERYFDFEDIYTEGITKITPEDMEYAAKLGRTIKLLGTSRRLADGTCYAMVAPFMLGQNSPLYSVNDVFNAVFVHGNMLGDAMFYGSGAGKLPTASAVVGDIVDAAKHLHVNIVTNWNSTPAVLKPLDEVTGKFFVRIKKEAAEEAKKVQAEVAKKKAEQQRVLDNAKANKAAAAQMEQDLIARSNAVKDLIQERIRQAEAARQAQQEESGGSDDNYVQGTGQLSWPCSGVITSPYGYRTHPIFGRTIYHSGMDIGVDYGTPIHAADSGTVIYSGWISGYGNAVIIDHGGGMQTLYGHNQSLNVSEGQSVSKGDVIAFAGSTGNSTGPHCHFEVEINGQAVDPMGYL